MRQLLSSTTLAAALLLAPQLVTAQTAQPGQGAIRNDGAQPDQPTGADAQATRGATAGQAAATQPPPPSSEYTPSMQRLREAAQRLRGSLQAMAQQPAGPRRNEAMAQAREAILHTRQAMVQLPPELRRGQNYRDAEQRIGEAEGALQGDQADPRRAQAAVDAVVVLIPRLEADAAGAATGVPLQRATGLLDADLIGRNGQEAGEVENLLIDRSGQVRAAVVEWGGFLGVGSRKALVPIEQLRLGTEGEGVRTELTRERLEALPPYEPDRLAEYGREQGWGEGVRLYR